MAKNYDDDWDDFDDSELEDWDYKPSKAAKPEKEPKKKQPKQKKIASKNVALHAASIKCPSCGANITVDTTLKTATCEYCGSGYNVREAISKSEAVMDAAKKAGKVATKAAAGVARELGKNKKLCENCGTEIAITANKCYKCGHKNPVPIYRKAWFWILIFLFVVVPIINFFRSCGDDSDDFHYRASDSFTEIKWPDSALAQMLPEPSNVKIGKIDEDSYDQLRVYLGDYLKEDYDAYVSKIKEIGFTEEYSGSDHSYEAKNADGYQIELTISFPNRRTIEKPRNSAD